MTNEQTQSAPTPDFEGAEPSAPAGTDLDCLGQLPGQQKSSSGKCLPPFVPLSRRPMPPGIVAPCPRDRRQASNGEAAAIEDAKVSRISRFSTPHRDAKAVWVQDLESVCPAFRLQGSGTLGQRAFSVRKADERLGGG